MNDFFKDKMKGKSPGVIAGIVIFGAIAILGLAILFGFIIMWLWNYVMPPIFDLPIITYWQAVGLFILAKLFFGFGGGGDSSEKSKKKGKLKRKIKAIKKGNDISCLDGYEGEDWKHYDEFWKTEGEDAFRNYKTKLHNKDAINTNQKTNYETNHIKN